MSSDQPKMFSFLKIAVFIAIILSSSMFTSEAIAQEWEEELLSLRLKREFGYGLGGQMQGTFSLIVSGSEELARVEFILDGEIIGEMTEAPFRFRIDTGDYASGSHRLQAVGFTADGQELHSATISRQFVAGNSVFMIVIFIVALVILFRVISYLLSHSSKGHKGSSLNYGFLGGAICPNCGHPFGLHWWSPRFGVSRFDRCSNCGKWGLVHRASKDALASAHESLPELDPEDESLVESGTRQDSDYRQLLDESRFDEN